MGNYFTIFYNYIFNREELQATFDDKSEFVYAIFDPT